MPGYNDELQFLEKPLTSEQFHSLVQTKEGYCDYHIEITEDKAIQNICGKGKVIIKYKSDDEDNFLTIIPQDEVKMPQYFVNKTENGFDIDIYINEKGISQINLLLNSRTIGSIIFNCTEEPEEKNYVPFVDNGYLNSDAELISPMLKYLTKGQKYTFELRTNDYENIIIHIGNERIYMTKGRNSFKESYIYIH